MASGCTTGGSSPSILFQKLTPDTLVKYTGAPFPQFGICTNDLLSEVEAAILQQIVNFSTGQNITLADIDLTQCDCFKEKVGCCGKEACQTLVCILRAYLDCMCELYADVQDLTTKVAAIYDGPYDTKCLSGVTSTSKLPVIVQEMITELCTAESNIASLTTLFNSFSTNLNSNIGTFLNGAIRSCQTDAVKKSGSGATFAVTFGGMAPIGTIMMYAGPIAGVFDSSGMGLSPGPACGWALCNGAIQNGVPTVDMRGYKAVGVNDGSMGSGGQNAEVNNSINPGQAYALNAHGGEINHLLSATESGSAPHTHTINDPLHAHVMKAKLRTGHMGSGGEAYVDWTNNPDAPDTTGITSEGVLPNNASISSGYNIRAEVLPHATGITINPGGGSSASVAHETRDPYRAVYFIQRVA